MKHLLLIDLSGLWWASWHATVDQEVSAAYERTVAKVRALSHGYDYVAVCCDAPPYFRKEILPSYKAQRDAPPEAALEQFRRVKDRLTADGYLLWICKGFEADDLIATATKRAVGEALAVTIASGDKDLLQLVSDTLHVRVVSTASDKVYNESAVAEKFEVPPAYIPDALALIGDKSDNVPGVPGVGPKHAGRLVIQWGGVEGILENLADVEPVRIRDAIAARTGDVRTALQLVQLRDDAPIDWDALFVKREPQKLNGPQEWDDAEFEDAPKEEPVAEPAKDETAAKNPGELPRAKPIAGPAEKPTSTLAIAPVEWSMQLEPADTKAAFTLATYLFDSRLYQAYPSREAIFAVILRGRALGLDATTSLANFHLVEGKPTMSADLIRGLVLASGKAEFFDLVESTREKATWITKRRGSKREAQITWTMDDAVDAGLVTRAGGEYRGVSRSGKPSNWDKYRRTMLRHRAGVELARAVYPDICAGLYTPEEITDGAVAVGTFDEDAAQ